MRSGARVAAGDADFVLTLISEILPLPGVELAGALPSEYQSYVNFSAGVAAHAAHAEAGQALVRFLASRGNAAVYQAKGMEQR